MDNDKGATMPKQSSSSRSKQVGGKPPARLKTIHQLKATDRPADVEAKLQKRAQRMLYNLCTSNNWTKLLQPAMPSHATQRIVDIGRCEQAIGAWRRDVTATATEIVAKFNDLLQEDVTLRIRLACVSSAHVYLRSNDQMHTSE